MMSSDSVMSPESTVTSLLATSGHLRSGLDPDPVPSITYRNKHYISASEALDDYISDYQKSLTDSNTSTGQIKVNKLISRSHPRNRDVLKTSLTDGELNFLNIPVRNKDSDGLSMTTDDLLALPIDGSLPVTRTSALLSQSNILLDGLRFNSSSRSRSRTSRAQNHTSQRAPPAETSSTSRSFLPVDDSVIAGSRSLHPGLDLRRSHSHQTSRSHHLPRWLTGQKSESDFSGIDDLKYPGWLEQCEEFSSGSGRIDVPHRGVPSWVCELEKPDTERHRDVKDQQYGSKSLCEMRKQHLQFSKPVKRRQIQEQKLCEDDKIDSLIFRAEQMINSSSKGLYESNTEQNRSGDVEDSLNEDRSWENPPVTFKAPVPVDDTDEQLKTEEHQSSGSGSSGYSSRKHPGPVEALKHMLLRLQTVEHNINQSHTSDTQTVEQLNREENRLSTSGESLQRVLHHVDRLKTLVDDMKEKS